MSTKGEAHKIFAQMLGKKVVTERLEEIGESHGNGNGAYKDCREYIILMPDGWRRDREGSDRQKKQESVILRRNIISGIYVYLKEGRIAGGHIVKALIVARSNSSWSYVHRLKPMRRDIRETEKILQYITGKQSGINDE